MMEQVRLCTVWPQENWLGTFKTNIQDWMNDLNMLLSCFRTKMSALREVMVTRLTQLKNKYFDPGDFSVEAVDVGVALDDELVGKVRLVGVDHDRAGYVLQDLDDGVVVLAVPTLLKSVKHMLGCMLNRLVA